MTPKSVVKTPLCESFVVFFILERFLNVVLWSFCGNLGHYLKCSSSCLPKNVFVLSYRPRDIHPFILALLIPRNFCSWGKHTFIFIHCCNKYLLTHILVVKKNSLGLIRYWLLTSPLGGGGGHAINVWWLLLWLMVFLCLFIPFTVTPECCIYHLHVNQDSAKFWHASGIYQIGCVSQASA